MKSQAETAGRLSRGSAAHPQKGTVLRDVELLTADGSRRLLSAVRGQSNIVMIFTAGQDTAGLIASLTGNAEALKENNARVLVIAPEHTDSIRALAPLAALVVAMDSPGQLHCTLGATDAAGNLLPTIYITDRFGEVFAALQSPEVAALPDAQELIRWLEFINQQCEECSPPEWPE